MHAELERVDPETAARLKPNDAQRIQRALEVFYITNRAMSDLLKKPKENRLRKGLPEGVASADKSGELEGVRVDAGIVFAKNRPYALCVMTTFLKDETQGEHAIEEMSRAAYEYFSRLGSGGTLGRTIKN